jgi:CRP-like cAMP-binding protein
MLDSSVLSKFPLFQDLSPALLEKLASASQEISVKAGEAVFREGEKADKLHFLIKGGVVLKVNIMTKPDSVTVSHVSKPNQCFGWSGIVQPFYYTASAFCEEDSVVAAVNGDEFMKLLGENPADGFKVMTRVAEIISDRLRNSRQALLKTL